MAFSAVYGHTILFSLLFDFNYLIIMGIWSSVIDGVGSLASGFMSGMFGSSSQESANQTNIMLAREANAQNRELYEKEASRQNLWNERQYEEYWKQRAYDSVANQRARYEDAGFNPYFQMSNIQAGQAAGSTPTPAGSASPPSMTPAHVEPYDPTTAILTAGQGLSNAVGSYFDNRLKSAEAEGKMIDNLTKYEEAQSRIREALSKVKANSAQANRLQQEYDIYERAKEAIIQSYSKQNKVLDEQAKDLQGSQNERRERTQLLASQTLAQDQSNNLFNHTAYWQILAMQKSVDEIISRTNLNNENAVDVMYHALVNKANEYGIRWDNDQKDRLKDTLDQLKKNELEILRQDTGQSGGPLAGKYNFWRIVLTALCGAAGSAAGAYAGAAGRMSMMRSARPYAGTRMGFTGTGVTR